MRKILDWFAAQEEKSKARRKAYKAKTTKEKFLHHSPFMTGVACLGIGILAGEILIGISAGLFASGVVRHILRRTKPLSLAALFGVISLSVPTGLAFYGATAAYGHWGMKDQVQAALAQKEALDRNRGEVSQNIANFAKNFDDGYVSKMSLDTGAINGRSISELDGPLSQKFFAWQIGGFADALPEELGKEPILPLRAITQSKYVFSLFDSANAYHSVKNRNAEIAETLGKEVSELTLDDYMGAEDPEPTRVVLVGCMVSKDKQVVRVDTMPDFYLLDNTEDPSFAPLKEVCLKALDMEDSPSTSIQDNNARLEAEFGPL